MYDCFFIGHHDAPQELFAQLEDAVARCVTELGCRHFLVGHYGNFDAMAAEAVRRAKPHWPEITLTLLLPYPTRRLLPPGLDGVWYPPALITCPDRAAIPRANQLALQNSRILMAYVRTPHGNAAKVLKAAQQMNRIEAILL